MAAEGRHYRRSDPLSARQREILALMARGHTNGAIADRLGITLDGVKWHIREIYDRLDCHTREEAVARWRAGAGRGRNRWMYGLGALLAGPRLAYGALGVVAISGIVVAVLLLMNGGTRSAAPPPAAPETEVPAPTEVTTAPATPLAVSDVRAALYGLPDHSWHAEEPRPFDAANPADAAVIAKVLVWFAEGVEIGPSPAPRGVLPPFGGLTLALRDETFLSLRDAWDCFFETDTTRCLQVPDQVDVYRGDGPGVRMEARNLAIWLREWVVDDIDLVPTADSRQAWQTLSAPP